MARRPTPPPPVLFLHIGWAREYRGAAGDPPLGKFGFMTNHPGEATGEARNFQVFEKRCYGYAPVRQNSLNLTRLGGSKDDDHVDGVLVVWTATDPAKGGRYIVGWYRNATVYAKMRQHRPAKEPDTIAEAAAEDCHLVPVDQRDFFIPSREQGFPGIAAAFFASDTFSAPDLARVVAYVNGRPTSGFYEPDADASARPAPDDGWPTQDPKLRAKVEKASVEFVVAHYRQSGCTVQSVEKENLGWDLNVTKNGRLFRVEVKGRAGDGAVEVTPNEYAAMRNPNIRMSYRLAIVHDTLTSSPTLTLLAYAPALDAWLSELGVKLRIKEMTGAVLAFR
jgi:hypothetical protein